MARLGKGKVAIRSWLNFLLILVQNNRTRESSVAISPSWSMLDEIEFHRLAKLRLEVDEPEDLLVHLVFTP